MRKIDKNVSEAVAEWRNFGRENTRVEVVKREFGIERSHLNLYLHGHLIAQRVVDDTRKRSWFRCDCFGLATQTTVARINAFLAGVGADVHCRIRGGVVEFCRTGLSMSKGKLATYVVSTGAYIHATRGSEVPHGRDF